MNIIERAVHAVARRTNTAVVETRSMVRSPTWSGGSTLQLSNSEQRWTASSVAYRCITTVSSNNSSLRLQVLREDDSEIEGHDLTRLWAVPNPLMSGRVFGEYLWQRLETRGETFVYLDRGPSGQGKITSMWPVFGDVTVLVDKNLVGEVVGFEVTIGGTRIPLLPSELLWLRYPDAENEWGSIAPLSVAAHAIGLDAHARAWQRNELRHGGRPTAVVYLGDLDDEKHQDTVAAWRSRVEGAENAGRALFVSGKNAVKVERMSLTPAELGWMDTRTSAWEEVMLSWGIPKDYLLGGATYENRAASATTLWSDALIPKLEVVAGEMTRQLLDPGQRARFDTDDIDALQESADAKVNRMVAATGVDLVMVDEGRAELGLDPLPNGHGQLTLTAYRALIQLQAQSLLLGTDPAARQMPGLPTGPLALPRATAPLSLPVSQRAGLSFDQAQAEYDHHERVGSRAVKRLAGKQEAIVLANLHKLFGRSGVWAEKRQTLMGHVADLNAAREGGEAAAETFVRAQANDLLDAEKAAAMTREQLQDFLTSVWTRGGETTAAALGVGFDVFELDILVAMDQRLTVLADKVTATTRQVLEDRVLLQGVANGESVEELAARVRAAFTDLSTWRATMIARTETVGGFNAASRATAVTTGLVTARVWLATGDRRTRDSHVMLDGERITGMHTRYANGCLHPGDPTGPPEETIQCRCVEVYETA